MTQPPNPNQPYQQPAPGTPPPPPAQGQYVPPPPAAPQQPYAQPQQPYGQPQQPYGQPQYGYALPESQAAKNAMIWGIVGLVGIFFGCGVLGLLGIPGITMGNKAKKEIAASGGRLGGESNANLGVIFGWIGTAVGGLSLLFWIAYVLFFAALFSSVPTTY